MDPGQQEGPGIDEPTATPEPSATPTPTPKPTPNITVSAGSVSGWDQVEVLEKEITSILDRLAAGQSADGLSESTAQAIRDAMQRAADGASVSLSADLTAVPTADPADAAQIETALGGGYTVHQYLDVRIDVRVDGTTVGSITHTSQPITLSVSLPAGVDGQLVQVIRWHDGTLTGLPATVENGSVRFTTDQFSTFAIVTAARRTDYVTVADIPEQVYQGAPVTPPVTVSVNGAALTPETDYTVSYANNLGPGTATAYISGSNDYIGIAASKDFVIRAPDPTPSPSPVPTAVPPAVPTPVPTSPVPPTGDETPLALYGSLLALCAGALALTLAGRRRRQR